MEVGLLRSWSQTRVRNYQCYFAMIHSLSMEQIGVAVRHYL